jgi:hypothetical protein
MKTQTIGYWVTTALIALAFGAGGMLDILRAPAVEQVFTHLGYPGYFAIILGIYKVLGAIAVLAPGLPRLKEWAYAGMLFDLTGAVASHAAVGDPHGTFVSPLVVLGLVAASWALRPKNRTLRAAADEESSAPQAAMVAS